MGVPVPDDSGADRPARGDQAPGDLGSIARRTQAAVAGHLGRPDDARDCLDDPDPAVRATALRALKRVGELSADEVVAALGDPVAAVRIAALELAAATTDVALGAAAARLDDADSRVVEAAAWACGEKAGATLLNDPGGDAATMAPPNGHAAAAVVAALARVAATHQDALCRESAIAALGAIGDPAGLNAILAGLDDKPAVRRRAVIALAPFDGPEVDEALARAGRDRDRQVRAAAVELGSPDLTADS